jgi:hypothetical protein
MLKNILTSVSAYFKRKGTAHIFELEKIKLPDTYDTNGFHHSYNGAPAWVTTLGFIWGRRGIYHRDDNKPSHVYFDGFMRWHTENKFIIKDFFQIPFTSNETTWEDTNAQI